MRTHCEIIGFCTIPELPAVPPDNRILHPVPQCNGATLDKHQWPLDLSERDQIKGKTENRSVAETIQSSTSIIPDDCCEFSECIKKYIFRHFSI